MWPTMTATLAGAEPYLYQPARLWFPSGGTWMVLSRFWPSCITGALTLIAGILMRTGTDLIAGLAGGGTAGGLGAGRGPGAYG